MLLPRVVFVAPGIVVNIKHWIIKRLNHGSIINPFVFEASALATGGACTVSLWSCGIRLLYLGAAKHWQLTVVGDWRICHLASLRERGIVERELSCLGHNAASVCTEIRASANTSQQL